MGGKERSKEGSRLQKFTNGTRSIRDTIRDPFSVDCCTSDTKSLLKCKVIPYVFSLVR